MYRIKNPTEISTSLTVRKTGGGFGGLFDPSTLTADQVYTLPSLTGTLALTNQTALKTGFPDRTSTTLTFNSTTRVVTLAPTGSNFTFTVNGVVYTKTTQTTTLPNVTGGYFIYFDNTGTFQQSSTPWNILTTAQVAYVYWDSTLADGFCFEERHGDTMDPSTHYYLHNVNGTEALSGFAISGYDLAGAGGNATNAFNTYSIATGKVADEDIIFDTSVLADNGPYTIFNRTGATGTWTWTKTNTIPFGVGTTFPQYNQYTGATWQLTEGIASRYINYFVFATTSLDPLFQYIIIPGQNIFTSLALAQAETYANLSLGNLPFQEIVPLYQITLRTGTGAAYSGATGSCRIEAVTGSKTSISQASITNHEGLSGLLGGDATNGHYHLNQAQAGVFDISGNINGGIKLTLNGTLYSFVGQTYSAASTIIGNNIYVNPADTVSDQVRTLNTHASYGHTYLSMKSGSFTFYGLSASVTADAIVTPYTLMTLNSNSLTTSGYIPIVCGGYGSFSGNIILATNSTYFQGKTSGGTTVNLFSLSSDANNITRFICGVDAGGFQWTNQAQTLALAYLSGTNFTVSTAASSTGSINVGTNVGSQQNYVRIYGGVATNNAPVLSLLKTGNTEGGLAIGSGSKIKLFQSNGLANYTDATIDAANGMTLDTTGNVLAVSFNAITGLASVAPLMDGTVAVGTSTLTARQDHVHPVDTSRQAALNGTGFVKASGTTISYDNSTYLTGTKVDSFNSRTGVVALAYSDVISALTYTPINKAGDTGIGNLSMGALTADGVLFNAFKGANSDGNNVWIGGGGQSSLGASGTTYMGSGNSATGYQALYFNTTGYFNSATGYQALYSNTTGYYNSAIGRQALFSTTTGFSNSAMGANALYNNTTGYQNSVMGMDALWANTTGYNNSAVGWYMLFNNTTGSQNSVIGSQALYSNTTGSNNSAVGVSALYHLAPTAKAISAFADYSGTVAGTVQATSTAHGRSTGDSVIISGTTNYNATKTITVIDVDNFYFTATWVSTQTGWWTLSGYVASNNTALGYYTGLGITTGSGNTVLGANVTGLSANLTNNIILANGTGAIKAQHDGTNWALTGGVSATAGLSGTTGRFSDVTDINLTTLAQGSIQTSGGLSVAKSLTVGGNVIIVGTQAAASGLGGNLRYRDDTGTARWLTGLKGTAAATSYVITDLVNSGDRLTITSTGAATFSNTVTATQFIGSGAGLTSNTVPKAAIVNMSAAGVLGATASGPVIELNTIPAGVLGNSTVYIGTTAVALNRASATLNLAGIGTLTLSDILTSAVTSANTQINQLYLTSTITAASSQYALRVLTNHDPASASSAASIYGISSEISTTAANAQTNSSTLYAIQGKVTHNSAVALNAAVGLLSQLTNATSTNIGIGYGIYVATPTFSSTGLISTNYGIYIANQVPTGVTAGYALYSAGTGKVYISDTSTDSTTVGSNSIATAGGLGVAGYIYVSNSTTSTGTTNGAVRVVGGVGIGGTLNVGGPAKFSAGIVAGAYVATLTSGQSWTPDVSSYSTFVVTLTNPTGPTINAPTGTLGTGQTINFVIIQAATAASAPTWNAAFKFFGTKNISTTNSGRSIVSCVWDGTYWQCTSAKDSA